MGLMATSYTPEANTPEMRPYVMLSGKLSNIRKDGDTCINVPHPMPTANDRSVPRMSENTPGALRFRTSTVRMVITEMAATGLQKSKLARPSPMAPSPWARATPKATEARAMTTTLRRMEASRYRAMASPGFKIPEVRASMLLPSFSGVFLGIAAAAISSLGTASGCVRREHEAGTVCGAPLT